MPPDQKEYQKVNRVSLNASFSPTNYADDRRRALEAIQRSGNVGEVLEIARRAKEKLQQDIARLQKESDAQDVWIKELEKLRDEK